MKEIYPKPNYRKAYDDLKRFFKRHNFSHRQGSGYISNEKLSTADIYDLIDDLISELSWVGKCVKKIDVTNVGQQHDLIDLLKSVDIMFDEVEILDEESD